MKSMPNTKPDPMCPSTEGIRRADHAIETYMAKQNG